MASPSAALTAPVRLRDHWRATLLLAVVSLAAVTLAYHESADFGFRYDDYHALRPWTAREVLGVFHRTWDPTGIEPRFYRPLTASFFALRFAVFGLNARAQHLLSLAGMVLCSLLTALFVWRESGRLYAASTAALLFAIYPAFVYSQAIWLTNQMHLLASVIVLAALLVWQRACRLGGAAWWWLLVLQVIGFGVKEDTIMLLPLLVALTVLRRWTVGGVQAPPPAVLIVGAALLLALPYWRYVALGRHLGGYGMPVFAKGWSNLSRIVDVFVQHPAKRPWQAVAGWYSVACAALGLAAAIARRNRRSLHLLGCGVLIAVTFNLPFYLVSKAEQYHLVGLGCVVLLAGALDAIQTAPASKARRQALGAIAAAAALCFLPVTRNIATDFAPCSAITLNTDEIVLGWWVVPHEVKEWLRQKPAGCKSAGALLPLHQALDTATWALGREIDERGVPVHWTSDRAVVLFRRSVERANVMVRSPVASRDATTTVTLRSAGGTVPLTLNDGAWHTQTVRLRNSLRDVLTGMHRLDMDVSPVFIPDEKFHNGDTRVLGVLMRITEVSPPGS